MWNFWSCSFFFFLFLMHNSRTVWCIWTIHIPNNYSAISYPFTHRTACELRLASYGSKHALQSLSNSPFVCTYIHNLKIIQVVYGCFAYQMTALLSETLCGLELHESSNWRVMALDTHWGLPLIQHCVCILQACTYRYNTIWLATMHDNKTHIDYDSSTHQVMALLPTMYCFIRTKSYTIHRDLWAAAVHNIYLHFAVFFQLQWTL